MIVMSVTIVLAGLLLPTLAQMRENAHRVMSASNLRQIGMALNMYHTNNDERLPYTSWLNEDETVWSPEELMTAYVRNPDTKWDGFGLLFEGAYIDAPSCFYSPSHTGEHPFERYEALWEDPNNVEPIYTNYHYAGDVDWKEGMRRQLRTAQSVLATDGMRTQNDLNHRDGINLLFLDTSVVWTSQIQPILEILPEESGAMNPEQRANYESLWEVIEGLSN